MPLTCRSWSSVHCDLLAKAEDPWNCFTLVRDTWAGFLFVTVEIKAQFLLMTSFAMQTNIKDVQPKFPPQYLPSWAEQHVFTGWSSHPTHGPGMPCWAVILVSYLNHIFHCLSSTELGHVHCCRAPFSFFRNETKWYLPFSGSPVNGLPLLSSGMIQKIKAGLD